MKYPNFVASSYTSASKAFDGERTINLYVETGEGNAAKDGAPAYLLGTPGYRCAVTLPTSPVRGLYSGDGKRVFAVAGAILYEITPRTPPPCRMPYSELRTVMILDAGDTPGPTYAATHTADEWAGHYATVTGENLPDPATYGFSDDAADGKVYARNAAVTIDQWARLFFALHSYHQIGTLPGIDGAASGRAQMFANGNSLFVVCGQHGYLATGTNIIKVTDASQGAYVDGYYIALNPDGAQFHISALYDGSSWSGLDFGSAEGAPDATIGILADHRELWCFGQQSVEVFVNTGNPNFPFERAGGGFLEQGCGAAATPVKLDNTLFWLGSDERGGRVLWRAQGYTPARVSNHAVESQWATYPRVEDAEAFGYQANGHSFLVIHFPSANKGEGATWVYDCAASAQLGRAQWHERANWDAVRSVWSMWRARCHAYARGVHFIGDWNSGKVYALDPAYRTNDGEPLRWLRSAPHIADEMRVHFYDELLIDMQVGAGLNDDMPVVNVPSTIEGTIGLNDTMEEINAHVAAGPQASTIGQTGIDPVISVRMSRDGGNTWRPERRIRMGKIGAYLWRARALRWGRARDAVFEVSGSDPAPVALLGADLRITPGNGS